MSHVGDSMALRTVRAAATAVMALELSLTTAAQMTYHVSPCGNDDWTGTSSVCEAPNGPKLTIQAGIDASSNGDEVIVANGTYTGAGNKNLSFHRKAIRVRSEGGPTACIIDCENQGRGLFFNGETEQSILDGFSIRNGAVSGEGGGVWCVRGSPTLIDCTFTANHADRDGGGMYNEGDSSPTLIGCTFIANTAALNGGGMANRDDASPTLIDCQFSRNSAGRGGGGMANRGDASPTLIGCQFSANNADEGGGMYNIGFDGNSAPMLTNCTFDGNTATDDGGGIYSTGGGETSAPTLTNCAFRGNRAGDSGGAMYNHTGSGGVSTPTLTNCTFSGNTAVRTGGAMVNRAGTTGGVSTPTLTNCKFSENTAGGSGGAMYNAVTFSGGISTPTLTNCTFSENTAGGTGGGLVNVVIDGICRPTLINCVVFSNTAGDSGGGLYNFSSSSGGTVAATLTNCTITGNSTGGIFIRARRDGVAELAVTSCIVWGNSDRQINGSPATIVVTFSDVQGGYPGIGNISADPLFMTPGRGNIRVSPGSPAIDAGDNSAVPPEVTEDLYGNPRFLDDPSTPDCQQAPGQCGDPPVVDMGASEFSGGSCDACDMNCDGEINQFDIEPFLELLFDRNARQCGSCTGDVNGDRNIDAFDIAPFLECLFP